MQEALLEAKRLNEMIAEDDARKQRESTIMENEDAFSSTTTEPGMATPTSSDSERTRHGDLNGESPRMLDQAERTSPRRSATSQTQLYQPNSGKIPPLKLLLPNSLTTRYR